MTFLASLGWQPVLVGAGVTLVLMCWAICALEKHKDTKRHRANARLNSPFFKNVYSAYYRANKLQ